MREPSEENCGSWSVRRSRKLSAVRIFLEAVAAEAGSADFSWAAVLNTANDTQVKASAKRGRIRILHEHGECEQSDCICGYGRLSIGVRSRKAERVRTY